MSIIDTVRRARQRAKADLAKARDEEMRAAEAVFRIRQKAIDEYLAGIDLEEIIYTAAMKGEDYATVYIIKDSEYRKIPGSGRHTTWQGQNATQYQVILSGFAKDLSDFFSRSLASATGPAFLPVVYVEFSNHDDPMNHFMDSVCLLQVCCSTSGIIS